MNTEKDLAKVILAYPREHYAAKDGAEPQTALLKQWDEFAAKYPELVESTQYFTGETSLDCMAIRFVEYNDGYLWLDLKTEGNPRQCCYKMSGEVWTYEAGDSEPPMSPALQKAWENGKGDAVISQCLETEQTQFLRA